MSGVKDKIDQQAQLLQEEEVGIKEKVDKLRQQQQQLKTLRSKLDRLQRESKTSETYDTQLKDAQVEFDKYLRFHAKDSKTYKRKKRSLQVEEKTEIASFKQRWADMLCDE